MKKIVIGLAAFAALFVAAPAQAHHASASAIKAGTYWKCSQNYAISKGKTKRTRGTTKRHTHIVQPSRQHLRRHKCRKIVRKQAPQTITKTVEVPGPERIVYVTQPCICPPPPECPTPCQPTPPDPCADPPTHGKKNHKHKKAKD